MSKFYILFCSILLLTRCTFAQTVSDEATHLIQLDRDFDLATAENGVDGWVAYFAPNGSMFGDTSQPTTGLVAIRAEMEPAFKDTNFSLRWQPMKAEMLIPDVLGYTVGKWIRLTKSNGKKYRKTGTYTTIWRIQPDKTWKIILDTGHPDGPAIEMKD